MLGSHLVDLADGWTLWRTFCLRGAGFPVNMLQKLAAPEAVGAIDLYLEHETAHEEARQRALASCKRLLDELDGDARRSLKHAARQIFKGGASGPLPDIPEMKPLLDALTRREMN